jgi:ribulose 1,5-bisphosphate synthetase/thiazole synthase
MPIDMTTDKSALERYKYDVLVIGAGGAGLRAAVEARLCLFLELIVLFI